MVEKEKQSSSCAVGRGETGSQGGEQQADVGGLLAIRGHGDFWAQATAQYHAWICTPTIARGCVDVCGSCCPQRPHDCPGSGLPPLAVLVFKGPSAFVALQIWVARAASQGHTTAGVCVDNL